jgi:hypothetical protein
LVLTRLDSRATSPTLTDLPLLACWRSSGPVTHGDVWLPQFEALITTARLSTNPNDFALVALLGLLGLRIFEACGASIADRTDGPILRNTLGARMDRHAATRRLKHLAATAYMASGTWLRLTTYLCGSLVVQRLLCVVFSSVPDPSWSPLVRRPNPS